MILIGQYDSPFVRRVAVALRIYGFDYEHRPWSVFGDAEKLAAINPLRRVPTLILDDGETLIESGAILDWLDERAGPARALIAERGPARRRALKICALATGLADKAVSLVYEREIHRRETAVWQARSRSQIEGVLTALEEICPEKTIEAAMESRAAADAQGVPGPWWFGERVGHADIAVACALRFLREAHPDAFDARRWPRLAAHAEACEALEPFRAVVQPFFVTPPEAEA